ncbi:hypothetical protein GCM10011487_40400 [Steroidobacter agaridevorans]|uniref:Methyltransferase type 11 domain-containing protein n=1 Tax=Steroidobacter agaridevorans TaxID=2695856 RepID=A0A829YFP1_9GAMM|nr:methyltransferase domain-containing protein [Steroidobacter agaridevorans]GFE82040.1 hypothetical protein GCM10011487_40400 [Steroidobacter agaridevorans]GFE85571.1 hypothetical protein GCM10011488_05250 [Steroidobacter agaridevorans]
MLGTILRKVASAAGVEISRKRDDFLLHLYDQEDAIRKPYFNIGSGSFWHPRWTNVDFVSDHYSGVQRDVVHHDLMSLAPLPIQTSAAKVIYTSHTIEHIKEAAVAKLFEEAYRCLIPGGILRVTTGPDADTDYAAMMRGDANWFYWDTWYHSPGTYERQYKGPADMVPLEERWLDHVASALAPNNLAPSRKFAAAEIREVINSMSKEEALDYFTGLCSFDPSRPHNHISWWNAAKIERFMRDAGFQTVYRSGYGQSASPVMRNSRLFDSTHTQMSVYVEAVR